MKMGRDVKGTNRGVLERLQKNPESGKRNVDYVLAGLQRDGEAKERELELEINRLKEEQERLKGKNPRGAGRKRKMSDEQIQEIIVERKAGATIQQLAGKYSCSVGLIHKLIQ